MNKPGIPTKQPSPVRQPVLLGLFTGTAVGAGYLLAGVPNVELVTLVVALAGSCLGPVSGAAVGGAAALIYSLGSPLGLPVPLLLAGQIVGLALGGVIGGIGGRVVVNIHQAGFRLRAGALAAGLGLLATLVYDLLTNLAIIGAFAMSPAVVLTGAVPFALWHMGVNTLVFAVLFPLLAHRLKGMAAPPLLGRGKVLSLLLVVGTALVMFPSPVRAQSTALDDSTRVTRKMSPPEAAFGWRRPLWEPYVPTLVQELNWQTNWLVVQDGGLGSSVAILGEAGTRAQPGFERDGVPLGTGHALLDDPWLVSNQGLRRDQFGFGPDLRRGNEGVVSLMTDDRAPATALSQYRGIKGPHETYHRGFSLMTPRTAWRLAFDFDESLDQEGYNYSGDSDEIFKAEETFRGHAKLRTSRTRLIRQLDPETSLALEYSTGRKTKDSLPAWGADHQEIWTAGSAATMKSRAGSWLWRTVVFHEDRDARWGDRPTGNGPAAVSRLLETTRQGISFDLVSSGVERDSTGMATKKDRFSWSDKEMAGRTSFAVRYSRWTVADTGAVWLPVDSGTGSGQGESATFSLRSGRQLGTLQSTGIVNSSLGSHGQVALDGMVSLGQGQRLGPRPSAAHWLVSLSRSSRRPSSDELLTASRRNVNGTELFILPNVDLENQKTWRLQALAGLRLLGFGFALDGSVRQLRQGVTWMPESVGSDIGRWQNALDMNSSRLTASMNRQGRFLGWGRLKLEGTWQNFDEISGRASLLPPEQYLRLEMMWEHHFFQEDGILQLALLSTRRGAMADPWDLTRNSLLPQATWHDLIVGFRLVGANLSLAMRNLTDQEIQWTAGARAPGREMDLRLHWYFHY